MEEFNHSPIVAFI